MRNLTNRKLSEVKYLEGIYNGIEFLMKIGSRSSDLGEQKIAMEKCYKNKNIQPTDGTNIQKSSATENHSEKMKQIKNNKQKKKDKKRVQ